MIKSQDVSIGRDSECGDRLTGRLKGETEPMQKLLTIYLDSGAYESNSWTGSRSTAHAYVEEHLQAELQAGWRIESISGFGGAAQTNNARGWFAVVLSRE